MATALGQASAFLFEFIGLLGNPLLIFIALFLYLGAAQEATVAGLLDPTAASAIDTDFLSHSYFSDNGPLLSDTQWLLAATSPPPNDSALHGSRRTYASRCLCRAPCETAASSRVTRSSLRRWGNVTPTASRQSGHACKNA